MANAFNGGFARDDIQEAAHGGTWMNRMGLTRKHHECRLKSIFGKMMIAEYPAAHAINLRPMAADKLGKRIVCSRTRIGRAGARPMREEPLQQFAAGNVRKDALSQPVESALQAELGHRVVPPP